MTQLLGTMYAAISVGAICFQIALIFGAPWERLTQGGKHDGALPRRGRFAAAASIILLILMGAAILSVAGYWPNWSRWNGWVATGVSAVSCILIWITLSAAERLLWAPITTVMLGLALAVMLGS